MEKKSIVGTIMLANDMMTLVYSTIFFKFVSDNWLHLFYIQIVLVGISTVILQWMPESPQFLLEKKRYKEAEIAYGTIASTNGKDPFILEVP